MNHRFSRTWAVALLLLLSAFLAVYCGAVLQSPGARQDAAQSNETKQSYYFWDAARGVDVPVDLPRAIDFIQADLYLGDQPVCADVAFTRTHQTAVELQLDAYVAGFDTLVVTDRKGRRTSIAAGSCTLLPYPAAYAGGRASKASAALYLHTSDSEARIDWTLTPREGCDISACTYDLYLPEAVRDDVSCLVQPVEGADRAYTATLRFSPSAAYSALDCDLLLVEHEGTSAALLVRMHLSFQKEKQAAG